MDRGIEHNCSVYGLEFRCGFHLFFDLKHSYGVEYIDKLHNVVANAK
jgi:hypothetical protein